MPMYEQSDQPNCSKDVSQNTLYPIKTVLTSVSETQHKTVSLSDMWPNMTVSIAHKWNDNLYPLLTSDTT